MHRVTDRLTKTNNRHGSISSGIVIIPIYKLLTDKCLKSNYFSIKRISTGVDARTAELYSEEDTPTSPSSEPFLAQGVVIARPITAAWVSVPRRLDQASKAEAVFYCV